MNIGEITLEPGVTIWDGGKWNYKIVNLFYSNSFILTYTCVSLLTTSDNGAVVKNCFGANPLGALGNWQPMRWIGINCM